MAGLCAPLSTLRRCPRGHLRMTRGRCGSLLLHRDGLAPSTPCLSSRFTPLYPQNRTSLNAVGMSVSCPIQEVASLFDHLVDAGEVHIPPAREMPNGRVRNGCPMPAWEIAQ